MPARHAIRESVPPPSREGLLALFQEPVKAKPLLDALPLGLCFMDADKRVLMVNRQFEVITGFSGERVAGVFCWDVLRCDNCQADCLAGAAAESGAPVSRRCTIITRERLKLSVNVTTMPVFDLAGGLQGFMETVVDSHHEEDCLNAVSSQLELGGFVGRSKQIEDVFRVVPVVAQTDSSVLITGETGTGKDLLAEIIHRNSERADGPFIKINCGSLPETLLESELFGHTKGAFTGAVSDKMGRLRLAHNGSVFLTEIGDLPLPLQVKLLTFLDDKVVQPLGSAKGFQADVRVLAATHRNLEAMVRQGGFRHDLLYRLNVVRLHLPPLRDRAGDIPLLLDHFLKTFAKRFAKPRAAFDDQARAHLLRHAYPGNVRELRNIVEYAVNVAPTDAIGLSELPAYLFDPQPAGPGEDLGETAGQAGGQTAGHALGGFGPGPDPLHDYAQAPQPGPPPVVDANWPDAERRLIMETLVACRGKKTEAAKRLGMSRSTLWRKMKHYGLDQ